MEVSAEGPHGVDVGWRVLGAFLCLGLAFGSAVMIIAMIDIAGTKLCGDVTNAYALAHPGGSCFSGSSFQKTISLVLGFPGGAIGGMCSVLALTFVITGKRGRLMILLTVVAIVLAALSILIGSV